MPMEEWMILLTATSLLVGLTLVNCTNNTPHHTTNQALTTYHTQISMSLTMEVRGCDKSAKSIKMPEAGQSIFSGCHIRVTREEKMIRTRVTGDKEPLMWAPDRSKKWLEFLEIPVRDDEGCHTRTITIGVVWREKREWDILGDKEDIQICAAYVEDFEIYFLAAVVKPKMTRNVMMTSFQATNVLNLLVMCDEKVLDIKENVVRRFAKVTARAIHSAVLMLMGPPSLSPTRPQIAKITSRQMPVMSTEMVNMIMLHFTANYMRVLCQCDYEARLMVMEACNIANKTSLFLGYSERVEVLAEGDEVYEWPVIEKVERKEGGKKKKDDRKEKKEMNPEMIQIDS